MHKSSTYEQAVGQFDGKVEVGGLAGIQGSRRARLVEDGMARLDLWPTVDSQSLPLEKRRGYQCREKSINLYFSGATLSHIKLITGVTGAQLYYFIDRCIQIHPDNRIYGYRALVPGSRLKPYKRSKPIHIAYGDHQGGSSGAFTYLLGKYPSLKELILGMLFPRRRPVLISVRKVSYRTIHKAFLHECRKLGLATDFHYPFNTDLLAYNSLCSYLRRIEKDNPEKTALYRLDSDAVKKLKTGDGSMRPILDVLDRVECDAHHLDALFCILIPTSSGNIVAKILKRLWLIAIIDVRSRAVLGYHLSLRRECNEEDLLRTIKNALSPWNPRALSVTGMRYDEHAGFPSSIDSAYVGACWNEFSADGAKINRSFRVDAVLKDVVGSSSYYNERRSPDDRPFIERFFRTLEQGNFHHMPNSVGGSPRDSKGHNPELAAVKYFIQLDHLYDILDIVISGYNATSHSSLGGRSPLEYFDYAVKSSLQTLRIADSLKVDRIYAYRKRVRVRGSLERGNRPFVEFMGARYTNEFLRKKYEFVGQSVTIEVNPQDPRVIMAFGSNGGELGPMYASAPWNRLPHTLEMRRAYNKAVRDGKIRANKNDAVGALLAYLEERARVEKHVPSLYLELRGLILSNQEAIRAEYDVTCPVSNSKDNIPTSETARREQSLRDDINKTEINLMKKTIGIPRKAKVGAR